MKIMTLLTLFIGIIPLANATQTDSDSQAKKQRIVIFSSTGGGGHTSAAQAIAEKFKNNFRVDVINIFEKTDSACIKSIGGSEYWYNKLLINNWTRTLNTIASLGRMWFQGQNESVEKYLKALVKREKPIALISVIPYIGKSLFEFAQEYQIPAFLLILDFDPNNFVYNISKVPQCCRIGIPHASMHTLFKEKFPHLYTHPKAVQCLELPVRAQFTETISLTPRHKQKQPLALLLMYGAQGGEKLLSTALTCAQLSQDYALTTTVCAGKNPTLKASLESLAPQFKGTYQVHGFVSEIAPLIKAADILITKPGGMSIMEALATKTPLLLDTRGTLLQWEQANADWAKERQVGWTFATVEELNTVIQNIALNKKRLHKAQSTLHALQHKKRIRLASLIKSM